MVEPRPLPMFEWMERQRQRRERRKRRCRQALIGAFAGIAGAAALAPLVDAPTPQLVWNASASAPRGLYRIAPGVTVARGDLVLVWLPAHARALAAQRRYLPANVPALKRVAAIAGDAVCGTGATVSIDGRTVATRRMVDRSGRPLQHWSGCMTLGPDAIFLLNATAPDSFDSRYFGPVARADVIGKAVPLWVR